MRDPFATRFIDAIKATFSDDELELLINRIYEVGVSDGKLSAQDDPSGPDE